MTDKGEPTGALENYRKALELRLVVASADPKNAFAINATVSAYQRIGGILLRMGNRLDASTNFQKMLEVHQSALPEQASDCAKIADQYSTVASEFGAAQRDRVANLREAVNWYRKSLDLRSRTSSQLTEAQLKERDRITQQIARCESDIANKNQSQRH